MADELWPALLTKVVKLYGSYAALDGGDLVRHARPRRRATSTPRSSLLSGYSSTVCYLGHEPLSVCEVA